MAASAPVTPSESIARVNPGRSSPRLGSPDDSRPTPPLGSSRGGSGHVGTLDSATARHCLMSATPQCAHEESRRTADFRNGDVQRNVAPRGSGATRGAVQPHVTTSDRRPTDDLRERDHDRQATLPRLPFLPRRIPRPSRRQRNEARLHRFAPVLSSDTTLHYSSTPTTTKETSRMRQPLRPRGPPSSSSRSLLRFKCLIAQRR